MRTESVLITMLSFLLGLLVVVVGVSLVCLHWFAPNTLMELLAKVESAALTWGILFFLFGMTLLVLGGWASRHGYLTFKMGSVRDTALCQLISSCLRDHFPGEEIPISTVIRRGGNLEIFAELPLLEVEAQERQLRELECVLAQMLVTQCGHDRPFTFHARFKQN